MNLLKACLNGSRLPGAHPALPISPGEIAVAARAAVAAGAGAVHVHPKDHTGADTLAAEHVDATVRAIRMVRRALRSGSRRAPGPRSRERIRPPRRGRGGHDRTSRR